MGRRSGESTDAAVPKRKSPPKRSSSTFTAVNAGETPTKRQRTTRSSTQDKEIEDEDEDNEDDEDDEYNEVEEVQAYERVLVGGLKNTRMKSYRRAEVNIEDVRQELCLRCAGEVAQFPKLLCSNKPNSSANKCVDCCKKGKSCELVPARLKPLLETLENTAAAFIANTATKADVDEAQATFDREKRRSNHTTKVSDLEAQKSPWKPVVNSTEQLCASVTEAIDRLHGGMLRALRKEFNGLKESNAALQAEVSGLRKDFRHVHSELFQESSATIVSENVEDGGEVEIEGPVTPQ